MIADDQVLSPHRKSAATMWGRGGKSYDDVSYAISEALAHAVQRLDARKGQRILDVATGTGWSARWVARSGASVVGVDISDELLAAARELSAHVQPPIAFQLADAEALPFADRSFDGVISTFGVMFAADQAKAASELARVCRSGARLSIASWAVDGSVAEFFRVLGRHGNAPAPSASPLLWGDPEHVTKLLGREFDLVFESGVANAYHGSTQDIWEWYARGFGPLRQLTEVLSSGQVAKLKSDVDAYHRHYAVPAGLHVKREYLITIGQRR